MKAGLSTLHIIIKLNKPLSPTILAWTMTCIRYMHAAIDFTFTMHCFHNNSFSPVTAFLTNKKLLIQNLAKKYQIACLQSPFKPKTSLIFTDFLYHWKGQLNKNNTIQVCNFLITSLQFFLFFFLLWHHKTLW